ncbi:MAG TPA: hypothetical protein VFA00_14025 [Actinomycetota bacterium]|jgi:hypothetical protein|nr:hypothetical protein [Actinomycetota bacterium]
MKRPGVIRGIVTGASVFVLSTLILSIGAGASLSDAEGRPAEGLATYSYVNVFLSSLLGAIAGVWQAARADLAAKSDALIAGLAGPGAAAVLLLLFGASGWSLGEILLSVAAVAAGSAAGAGFMARRLRYVPTD